MTKGGNNCNEALRFYGKAFSVAQEKGLSGKMPTLLFKMGKCFMTLAKDETEIRVKLLASRKASWHMSLALLSCYSNGEHSNQSDEWIKSLVCEAQSVTDHYFNHILAQVEDKLDALKEASVFATDLLTVHNPNHPFLDVCVSVHKQVAFMALDRATYFLTMKDHHEARQCIQMLKISLDKTNASYDLQEKNDTELTREIRTLSVGYLTSCDVAQALEALEAGTLITSLANKDLSSNDLESALTHGWNALDKFKEANILSDGKVDDIFYQAKAAQGDLYMSIFKIPRKAEKIYTQIIESSASQNHQNTEWFQQTEINLRTLKANNPTAKKAQLLRELQPDLEKMATVVKEAGGDLQVVIDFCYTTNPPIPNKRTGTLRPKPLVSKLGRAKAIKKMILFYHPDKIDKSDLKYQLLCEEITKTFTEMNQA